MTDAEVNVLLVDAAVTFSSYYKYSFAFQGEGAGLEICCGFGGDSGDIYKSKVTNEPRKFGKVEDWDWVDLKKNGQEVYSYRTPRW